MLSKVEKTFAEELEDDFFELKDAYDNVRDCLIEIADRYDLTPEYAYENASGRETPEGFNYFGQSFSIRDTKLFYTMTRGSQAEIEKALIQLRNILNDPEQIIESELVVEIFGSTKEKEVEKQKRLEAQEKKEREKTIELKEEKEEELKEAA